MQPHLRATWSELIADLVPTLAVLLLLLSLGGCSRNALTGPKLVQIGIRIGLLVCGSMCMVQLLLGVRDGVINQRADRAAAQRRQERRLAQGGIEAWVERWLPARRQP